MTCGPLLDPGHIAGASPGPQLAPGPDEIRLSRARRSSKSENVATEGDGLYAPAVARQPDLLDEAAVRPQPTAAHHLAVSQIHAACKHESDSVADGDHSAASGAERQLVRDDSI
jgi:hypothetical protein